MASPHPEALLTSLSVLAREMKPHPSQESLWAHAHTCKTRPHASAAPARMRPCCAAARREHPTAHGPARAGTCCAAPRARARPLAARRRATRAGAPRAQARRAPGRRCRTHQERRAPRAAQETAYGDLSVQCMFFAMVARLRTDWGRKRAVHERSCAPPAPSHAVERSLAGRVAFA